MGLFILSGRPPAAAQDQELRRIRRLLGEGSLTKAARRLDAFVLAMDAQGPALSSPLPAAPVAALPAPAAAAAAAAPALRAAAPALSDTPILLSQPAPSQPVEPRGAASAEPAPVLTALAATAAPQEPGRPWWLFAAAAGVLAFAGAAVLLVASRQQTAAAQPAAPPPLSLTEKYSLGPVIASGGMGEVYEGRDLRLGRRVAIKRMLSEVKLDAALRAQFLKEARTVAKLSHPYIIPIHDCLESAGDLYLVFEYVDGETLARVLQREARLPLKGCRRIFQYVCPAVDHAHKHHILHRDLKPANIMIDSGGIARVMDFGIALESTRTITDSSPAILDASGTIRYMPPEQHYGRSVRASDVYAMGVCLYEMATGHPPFPAASVDELIAMKRARRYPPPSTLLPELPKELDFFIAAVLEPDPRQRVSSAMEFLDLLGGLPAAA
jgi:tRNA A-37 threonylcarbamoyl transferase component Bud32